MGLKTNQGGCTLVKAFVEEKESWSTTEAGPSKVAAVAMIQAEPGQKMMEEKTNSQSASNTALGGHLAGRSAANEDDIVGFAGEAGDWV